MGAGFTHVQWLIVSAIVLFALTALLVLWGIALDLAPYLPFASVVLGALSGALALMTQATNVEGKLTRCGKIAVIGLLSSCPITFSRLVID